MRAGSPLLRPVLWLALLLSSGCQTIAAAPPPPQDSPADARDAVSRVFKAYAEHDCVSLDALLGGKLRARHTRKGCVEALAHEPLRSAQLVHIGEPKRDGRDPSAWMVNVVLRVEQRHRPLIVRVEHTAQGHQIVAM